MCDLRLPENASKVLQQCWPAGPGFIHETPKWLIYTLDSAPREADELYRAARASEIGMNSVDEADWDETLSYLKPSNQNFPAPDLQHILDHHFRMLDQLLTQTHQAGGIGEWKWLIYLDGFIIITEDNWRENGVTAVHCDRDRGKLKVTKCSNITIENLLSLGSIIELDEHFDHLRESFDDGSGNDGPDNQGGPAPVGEWQFSVYCTGSSDISIRQLQQRAKDDIPDPRGDYSYQPGDACLDFLSKVVPANLVNEDWPLTYAELMNNPIVKSNQQPRIVKPHPSLFVHIRGGQDPGEHCQIAVGIGPTRY